MQETTSGIYRIENTITRKVYIGQASNLKKRYCDHISALRRGNHDNKYLQNAWNKYEEEDFVFSILEKCDFNLLAEREQYWMDRTQCYIREYGYNINPSSTENPMIGNTHTKEARAKISAKAKGRKMSKSNFEALMLANKNVAKPDRNLPKKNRALSTITNKSLQSPRKIQYEYHIIKSDGEYIMTTNLTEFCEINRCSQTHLRNMIFNNKFYKGWYGIAIPFKKKPNLLSPTFNFMYLNIILNNWIKNDNSI